MALATKNLCGWAQEFGDACFQGEGGREPGCPPCKRPAGCSVSGASDGVGVADIAKEAGLTHGALYAHFPSKDALAAEAFSYGFAGNMADTREWAGDRCPPFQEYLDGLLSPYMRDKLETGCPLTASASEIARQGCAVSASFTRAFEEMVAMMEGSLEDTIPASQRRRSRCCCCRRRDRRYRGIARGRKDRYGAGG